MECRQGRALRRILASALLVYGAAACSGGSGGASGASLVPGPDPPASDALASRFLAQATFGATRDEISKLRVIGYTAWFDEQFAAPVSLERPALSQLQHNGHKVGQERRQERWWKIAVQGPDQLRQRVAFALSEIFVISDVAGDLEGDPLGVAEYYDTLARDAFGNFRVLLEDVTLSPQMGKYLSMLRNPKPDPASNIRPDENYAREVMQLFTIGLKKLNSDGTPQLDINNLPVPTFDQSVVEGFAHVFTGWNYAGADSWEWGDENYLPMEPWESYHDTGAKILLDGHFVAPGQTAREDLDEALDVLFNHQNVAPFIARRLIQRLVTSNPSPAYIGRVAATFDDDGAGQRGNLWAVVKAILTDVDARTGNVTDPTTFGKLREPLLRQTALWRAFDAHASDARFREHYPESDYGQAALRAPSVFNFFAPDYRPPASSAAAGLFAPEFQITTDTLITTTTNKENDLVFYQYAGNPHVKQGDVLIRVAYERSLADDPAALVDHLDVLLMGGTMSAAMRSVVIDLVDGTDASDPTQRVLEAIYIIITSPEFAVQK